MALSKFSGRDLKAVVQSEITAILNKTIDYTYSTTKQKINSEFQLAEFTSQPPTLYAPHTRYGLLKRASANTYGGKLRYYLSNHYPDRLWSAIVAARQKSLKKRQGAVGLAKKSWWNIGRALGLNVKGGRFVVAVAKTGRNYPEDYVVNKEIKDDNRSVTFINAQPTVNSPGIKGAGALQAAINGRVKYFNENMKRDVFNSMANIAKRYPGLKIIPR